MNVVVVVFRPLWCSRSAVDSCLPIRKLSTAPPPRTGTVTAYWFRSPWRARVRPFYYNYLYLITEHGGHGATKGAERKPAENGHVWVLLGTGLPNESTLSPGTNCLQTAREGKNNWQRLAKSSSPAGARCVTHVAHLNTH